MHPLEKRLGGPWSLLDCLYLYAAAEIKRISVFDAQHSRGSRSFTLDEE
jgi:hypothetical protein